MDRAKCFFDTYNSFTKIYGPSFDQIGRRPSRRWAWLKNWVLGYNSSPFFHILLLLHMLKLLKQHFLEKWYSPLKIREKST